MPLIKQSCGYLNYLSGVHFNNYIVQCTIASKINDIPKGVGLSEKTAVNCSIL